MDICRRQTPPDFTVGAGHTSACWLADPQVVEEQLQGAASYQ